MPVDIVKNSHVTFKMQFKLSKIDKLNLNSSNNLKLQNTRHVTLIIQFLSMQHCKCHLTLSKTVT